MRRGYVTLAGAMTLLIAAACSDRTITDPGRGLSPHGARHISAAGFTTINGTGDCLNGPGIVNCNIYDSKDAVWMNGGPVAAGLADGDYFFAVVSPGGNPDPNDGSLKLLSSDLYGDRTFTVSGGTLSYSGPHVSDLPKIQLQPYADTPNAGGVYIMAICSLADGYPVDPNDCKYDAFKISSDGTVTLASDLSVNKTAAGGYKTTYAWNITKDVDKTIVKQVGGSATFNYTVKVSYDGGTVSNVAVSGKITVTDPNVDGGSVVPVDITSVTDQLSDGTNCTVTGGGVQTLTTATKQFDYSCTLSALPTGDLTNKVTVTWPTQLLTSGTLLNGSFAQFETPTAIVFTNTEVDKCTVVKDSYAGTLGTVCVGDANPTSFTYSRTITVPTGCQTYNNTAADTTVDLSVPGSASQSVQVCGPTNAGALTIGFWKGPNGNALIQYFCTPSGKTSLATYLAGLGSGSGPFSDATGKTCPQLVTYVNGIITGANGSNMNSMLKAQMLATALDVYFSTTTLGYSTTPAGSGKTTIKPPSNFLPGTGLGGFKMDLTAICPMVDNTTAGTATCQNNKPSTDGTSQFGAAALTIQAILNLAATTPAPFNGVVATPIWYAGDKTKEEVLKNVFDQFNNGLAFQAP